MIDQQYLESLKSQLEYVRDQVASSGEPANADFVKNGMTAIYTHLLFIAEQVATIQKLKPPQQSSGPVGGEGSWMS